MIYLLLTSINICHAKLSNNDVKYFVYQYNDVVKIKRLIPVGFYQGTCVLTLTRGTGNSANEKQILK